MCEQASASTEILNELILSKRESQVLGSVVSGVQFG